MEVAYVKNQCLSRISTHALLCVAGLTLFSGISYALYQIIPRENHFDHDSLLYDRDARTMHLDGQLEHNAGNVPIQTIVYPWLVGLLYRLTHNGLAVLIMVQWLLAVLSMGLTYRIAYLLFGHTVATCSLVLCCLNLGFITYTQLILAEIALTFLLLLFFERWQVCSKTQSYTSALKAGAALGCSLIVKPIALMVPFFLLIKQRSMAALLVCLASYGLVGMYMTRNYFVYNSFSLAPMMSLNVYQCFLSKVIGRLEQRSSYEVAQTTLAFKAEHAFDEAGWGDARALFYTTLINHPRTCVLVWAENVCKTLLGLFSTQFKQLFAGRNDPENPHSFFLLSGSFGSRIYDYIVGGCSPAHPWVLWIALGETVWSVVRWVLVIVAGVVLVRRRDYATIFWCALFILVLASMTGMDGCCRYRMTFEPILIILTAYGICLIKDLWHEKRIFFRKSHQHVRAGR